MDKSSNKITGLSAKSVMNSSGGKTAITGLKFKGSDVDNGIPQSGNAPSASKTKNLKSKAV